MEVYCSSFFTHTLDFPITASLLCLRMEGGNESVATYHSTQPFSLCYLQSSCCINQSPLPGFWGGGGVVSGNKGIHAAFATCIGWAKEEVPHAFPPAPLLGTFPQAVLIYLTKLLLPVRSHIRWGSGSCGRIHLL